MLVMLPQEIWYTMQTTGITEQLLVSTNMNCTDTRILRQASCKLSRHAVAVLPPHLAPVPHRSERRPQQLIVLLVFD